MKVKLRSQVRFRKSGSGGLRALCVQPREHVIGGRLQSWSKALFCELFGGRQRPGGGIEFDQGFVGGLGLHLPFAQALERILRFRQRGFVGTRGFDAAAAKRANRFSGAGQTTAAVEIGDARLGAGNLALQPRDLRCKQRARGHRGVAVGLQIRDRLRGLPREVLAAAIERRSGPHFEIGDARVGGVEPAALLLVLGNRERQAAFAALDRGRRIARASEAVRSLRRSGIEAARPYESTLPEAEATLKRHVSNAEARITELDRGRRIARASEAVRTLRRGGIEAARPYESTLPEAERTLRRLRERQMEAQAADDALIEIDAASGPLATAEKLAEQGFGPRMKSTADDVLARLKAKRTPAA